MSPTVLLLILFMSFATIGVAASIFMGRRGHNPFAWLLLGAILGPVVIPVIAVAVHEERMRQRREVVGGTSAGGAVDVLVGIDGSPEAEAAMRAAASLFGHLSDASRSRPWRISIPLAPGLPWSSSIERSERSSAWRLPSRRNDQAPSSSRVARLMP